MTRMGAGVAIGLLAAAIALSAPSPAFALRLGPLHLSLPFFGHSHAHRHRARLHADDQTGVAYNAIEHPEAAGKEPALAVTGPASPLLDPGLALPAIYDDVFWPASSWPFSYDEILQAAFGKTVGGRDRRPCQADRGSAVVRRLAGVIRPGEAQRPHLQKLGGALAMASGFLGKFCPNEIPARPVARLQLAETQLQALTVALDILRGPAQELEHSLNRDQQARLAAALAARGDDSGDASASTAAACEVKPTAVERTVDALSQSVQPENDVQRTAMAAAKQAFDSAASDLNAQCPMSLPGVLSERIRAMQAHLDAVWHAAIAIRVALENLDRGLNDKQRARVNALDFASGQDGKLVGRN